MTGQEALAALDAAIVLCAPVAPMSVSGASVAAGQDSVTASLGLEQQQQQAPPNKFSAQYASYINAKPRAQASAKIRLGGVFS